MTSDPQATSSLLFPYLVFGPVFGVVGMLMTTIVIDVIRANMRTQPFVSDAYRVMFTIQRLLILIAFLLFTFALTEPAARNDWGGGTIYGLTALIIGFPFWIPNLWFLASPLILWWLHGAKIQGLQIIPFLVQSAWAIIPFHDPEFGNPKYPGYTLWIIAHCLVALAYAIPTSVFIKTVPYVAHPLQSSSNPPPDSTPSSRPDYASRPRLSRPPF